MTLTTNTGPAPLPPESFNSGTPFRKNGQILKFMNQNCFALNYRSLIKMGSKIIPQRLIAHLKEVESHSPGHLTIGQLS